MATVGKTQHNNSPDVQFRGCADFFFFFFLHRPIVVRQDSDDGEALGGGRYQLLKGVKTAVQ